MEIGKKKRFRIIAVPALGRAGLSLYARTLENAMNRLTREGYVVQIREEGSRGLLVVGVRVPSTHDLLSALTDGLAAGGDTEPMPVGRPAERRHADAFNTAHGDERSLFELSNRTAELVARFSRAAPGKFGPTDIPKVAGTCLQGYSVAELDVASSELAVEIAMHNKDCKKRGFCYSLTLLQAVLEAVQNARRLSVQ